MGRGNESYGKKEVRAKQEKKRKDKEKKKLERKQQSRDGNNLDDMIAYVDEFGNITSTPPDLTQKKEIKAEDIEIGVRRNTEQDGIDHVKKGVVTFFDQSKGFGFIRDAASGQDVFVHVKALTETLHVNDKVTYETIKGPRGLNAINVTLIKS